MKGVDYIKFKGPSISNISNAQFPQKEESQ